MVEFILFFVHLCQSAWSHLFSETGDNACINSVRFSKDSKCFGEITNLPRIDDRHKITGVDQCEGNGFLVTTGCFNNNQERLSTTVGLS